MGMIRGFLAAVGILTTVPVPCDMDPRSGIPYFPFVGVVLGAVVALVAFLFGHGLGWHEGGAVFSVLVMTLLTGALHLDGLADTADAVGVQGVEEKLRVMRDPHLGSFGVVAIVLALLFKTAAIQTLSSHSHCAWMILPCTLSRTAQVVAMAALRYARSEGKGKLFTEATRPLHTIPGIVLCGGSGWLVMRALSVPVLACASLILTACLLRTKKNFGGITGDLIGAISEGVECSVWGLLALVAVTR